MAGPEQRLTPEGYPPITEYSWKKFDDLHESMRSTLTDFYENNLPGANAYDILITRGHHEETLLTGIVTELAMRRLMEDQSFPKITEVREISANPRTIQQGGFSPVGQIDISLKEGGETLDAIVFNSYPGATYSQYARGRSMIIDKANQILKLLNRTEIPRVLK